MLFFFLLLLLSLLRMSTFIFFFDFLCHFPCNRLFFSHDLARSFTNLANLFNQKDKWEWDLVSNLLLL
jgi:hypothetical protein